MKKTLIITVLAAITGLASAGQEMKWYNPLESEYPVIQQRAFSEELKDNYHRFPDRMKDAVSPRIWELSTNSAGLAIHFRTDADKIIVRYTVSGWLDMPHMPKTGVSGLDLYSVDEDGKWHDVTHSYSFADTLTFTYSYLEAGKNREYRMFLPLYNTVTWMEIGVPDNATFRFESLSEKRPIVVYGTSIAQGGCASRPGNAWTNILARHLDIPVYNFGFSGNGRMDKEILDLLNEIDAEIFILDCYPNMNLSMSIDEKRERTINAIRTFRERHDAPIILIMHSGFNQNESNRQTRDETKEANIAAMEAYQALKREVKDLYVLEPQENIATEETTVEGIHPNDFGMMIIARNYEHIIRKALKGMKLAH